MTNNLYQPAFQSLSVGASVTDQFTYTLDDGNNHTATAIVSVTVNDRLIISNLGWVTQPEGLETKPLQNIWGTVTQNAEQT